MFSNESAIAITVNEEERELVVVRDFHAPRELVWRTFTEPEHLARWWAPSGYTIPVCKVDLRPGGMWHYSMRSSQGEEHWVRSIYSEVSPPEKFVYTCTFADEHANPTDDIPTQTGIFTFEDIGEKTRVVTRFQFETVADLKTTVEMGLSEGITITYGQLAAYLQEIMS